MRLLKYKINSMENQKNGLFLNEKIECDELKD